ncbi:hypothetical protein L6452_34709 [Arctium lappa]|uniref:Uncharacterized protein n=1 Tax=Arctium lappa TaxID=4217 RepID=A0ACB8YN73_ARCLA|nr:hypothetical protein L6452_34709 [Arctium lappa]
MDTGLQQGWTQVFSKDGHRSSARYKVFGCRRDLRLLKTERSSALKTERSSAPKRSLRLLKMSSAEDVFGRRRLQPKRSSAPEDLDWHHPGQWC